MKYGNIVKIVISFIVLTWSGVLYASDIKQYSGTQCVVTTPNVSHSFTGSGIKNTSSNGTLKVTCPATRDNTKGGRPKGWVRIVNYNNSVTMCGLSVQYAEGTQHILSGKQVTGPSPSQTLYTPYGTFVNHSYNQIDLNSVTGMKKATYGVYCELPPGVVLSKYEIYEIY